MCPQLLSEQASKIDGIALSLLIWPFVSTFQWPVTLVYSLAIWDKPEKKKKKKERELISYTFLQQLAQAGEHAPSPTTLQNPDQSINSPICDMKILP